VHKFGADSSAVDPAGFLSKCTIDTQFRMGYVRQKAERVEISFEVSPMAERIENALAVSAWILQNLSNGSFTGSLSSSGHISTIRITDDAAYVLDSGLEWDTSASRYSP
jgi:hypothetical protein